MVSRITPGSDDISAVVYKMGTESSRVELTSLAIPCGAGSFYHRSSGMPLSFNSINVTEIASLVTTAEEYPSYQIAGKILARILLNHLLEHLEQEVSQVNTV